MPLEHDMRVKSALRGTFRRKKSSLDMNTTEQTAGLAAGAAFRHEALLYSGHDGFLAGTLPFIRAGLEADEPVVPVVSPAKIDLLRQAWDGAAEDVRFADMHEVGSNPARIIPAWREFVDGYGGRRGREWAVRETLWAERSAAELDTPQRHENGLRLLFGLACALGLKGPYDTDVLDPLVIA